MTDPARWRAASPERESEDAGFSLDRRDFLKAAGFTVAAASLAGCARPPAERALPFLQQPEEVIAGRSYWMASTCAGCEARCGTLLKCRDGRPLKLEGNPAHPVSRGGLCAVGQASTLGLYDSKRLRRPRLGGAPAAWPAVDREVAAKLGAGGARVRLLTRTVNSPTEISWIGRFLAKAPGARHVQYDPLSVSAVLDAHERTHGARVLPRYRFEQAAVIASFDADFLGTWISPVEHTAGYRAGRDLAGKPPRMSWHFQAESRMSLTGANADRRVALLPGEMAAALGQVAALLAPRAGAAFPAPEDSPLAPPVAAELADRLWAARAAGGHSLVVCGSQDVAAQALANFLNRLLGNYGATLDLDRPSYQRRGDDRALAALLDELAAGQVDVLLVRGNPVAELPGGEALAAALRRVPLAVAFASHQDETARLARIVCPEPHFLESWGDAEPVTGVASLCQPAVNPFGQTRTFAESLAAWCGEPRPARDLVRDVWRREVQPRSAGAPAPFETFWQTALNDGFTLVSTPPRPAGEGGVGAPSPLVGKGRGEGASGALEGTFTLVLYPTVALLDGRHAQNAWLQELPDPLTKVTWDNYATLSPGTAAGLGVEDGDLVRLSVRTAAGERSLELPACVQPGQHDRVVAVALGYGRAGTDRFADAGPRWWQGRPTVEPGGTVGGNAAPFAELRDGTLRYHRDGVRVARTGGTRPLAVTQLAGSLEVPARLAVLPEDRGYRRPVVQEAVLPAYADDPRAGAPEGHQIEPADLWQAGHQYPQHRWAMAVDLNACTGCSGCVVACQVENNVPVVGRDEVRRQREMSWLRIDRYWSGEGEATGAAFQPMMCQHCGNAPCESVCPVAATVHSDEGLNQQVYNRCVGTRYCANNCPYKARRFNWFDYPHEDRLANLALNPEVTVRARGVMEKCSFCVQRIQEAKMESKVRGTPVADGEVQPACVQSCPAQALVFGDLNDPRSRISRLVRDPRGYRVLSELNVEPSVVYLRKVRNRPLPAGAPGGREEDKQEEPS